MAAALNSKAATAPYSAELLPLMLGGRQLFALRALLLVATMPQQRQATTPSRYATLYEAMSLLCLDSRRHLSLCPAPRPVLKSRECAYQGLTLVASLTSELRAAALIATICPH